jgi:hypothetical protein
MISNGRRPQNIKLRGLNQNKKINLKGRRPPMEDYLKIFKVDYLSNHGSDLPELNVVLIHIPARISG